MCFFFSGRCCSVLKLRRSLFSGVKKSLAKLVYICLSKLNLECFNNAFRKNLPVYQFMVIQPVPHILFLCLAISHIPLLDIYDIYEPCSQCHSIILFFTLNGSNFLATGAFYCTHNVLSVSTQSTYSCKDTHTTCTHIPFARTQHEPS